MNLKKLLLLPLYIVLAVFLAVAALAVFPYIFTNIYKFPDIKPFAGEEWYNPYADTSGKWFKSNFHAHSKAWGGLTNGKLSPNQLDSVYLSLGYDFIGISNYHLISKSSRTSTESFIPIYEHGLNIFKRHQHPLGAKEVVHFDYPLFQSLHHKQDIIERLRPTTKLLAINHPEFLGAYDPEDFNYLSNYTHIEILNHYRTSLRHWDAALSAGYPAFAYGNDDSHDQTKSDETGRFWTMVRATSNLSNLFLDALRKGNTIAVKGERGVVDNELRYLKVENDTLNLKLASTSDSIVVVGNFGERLVCITNSDSLLISLTKLKAYARVEIYNPETSMYLNPVIRTEGILPTYKPVKNAAFSFLVRIVGITLYAAFLLWILKYVRKIYRYYRNRNIISIV